ncbi:salicylate synthase [Catenuloplanes japonicus]|uniref:salicylate synthase n=1 Tax=Catenuloplanes japonicus TaxID=33876 RepID=UPI00068F68E7|nr:salicylate synthase [Catenuloplanes japonicus]
MVHIYRTHRLGGTPDPLRLATRLARGLTVPFVLYERPGTWTLAAAPVWELILRADTVEIRADGVTTAVPTGDDPMQQVRALLADCPVGGWRVHGWAAFELGRLLHGGARPAGDGVLLHLMVPGIEARIGADAVDLRALSAADLDALAAAVTAGPVGPEHGEQVLPDVEHGAEAYRTAVAAAVGDIRDRRLQKVILSRVVPVSGAVDLAATYELGRRANTPARSFLLRLGDATAAGFSPETVAEVHADGTVSTQPLAGTRAFSGDHDENARLRTELTGDAKEIFEHAISVKLACEELTGLCVPGSVQVGDFMTVTERGSVQHLASRVNGRLAEGRNAWHAFAALFPAVTASGIPKLAACESIHRYETAARGLYSGAVLTASHDGDLDAALVLRTVFQDGGRTWLRAGAGIVEQSTPERELEETREKLRSVSRFLVRAAA